MTELTYEMQGNISSNFDDIKKELQENLEKYKELTVTEETLKDCKSQQRELAGLRNDIDKKRKEAKKQFLKPLEDFEAMCGELYSLVTNVELPLQKQIDIYNQKVIDGNIADAENEIKFVIGQNGIMPEFQSFFETKPFYKNLTVKKSEIKSDIQQQLKNILLQQNSFVERKKLVEDMIEEHNGKSDFKLRIEDFNLIDEGVVSRVREQVKRITDRMAEAEKAKQAEIERKRQEMIEKSRITVTAPLPDMYEGKTIPAEINKEELDKEEPVILVTQRDVNHVLRAFFDYMTKKTNGHESFLKALGKGIESFLIEEVDK